MSATPRVIVTELEVLLPSKASGTAAAALPASALEHLGRAHHTGARLYLLAPPLARSDGADLDEVLARCERVARQLQDSGSRLEGALLPERGDDATAMTVAELSELCRRLQCEADSLELVAASSALREAAGELGVARVHAATADAPFPHLGEA